MCLRPLHTVWISDFDTEQKRKHTRPGKRPDLVPPFWWFHDVGRSSRAPESRASANENGAG